MDSVKFKWDKIVGYNHGCDYLNYELTIFNPVDGDYKWFIDSKDGESIACGYGLTKEIAKRIAEITLLQFIEKEETNYEKTTYDDSYIYDGVDDDDDDCGYYGMWGFC